MAATPIPKMKLWYYPKYRSVRCAWLIKELDLDHKVEYKFVEIGPPPPSPEREEFRKTVHLHSSVPALEIEGSEPMLESTAICLYLAELGDGRMAPEPKNRAAYYDWMLYAGVRLDEAMEVLTWQWWFGPPEQRYHQAIEAKARAVVDLCLDRIESRLKDNPFIMGKALTAVDCVLGYNLLWADWPEMKDRELVKDRPNIQAYLQRINARPALQGALNHPGQ